MVSLAMEVFFFLGLAVSASYAISTSSFDHERTATSADGNRYKDAARMALSRRSMLDRQHQTQPRVLKKKEREEEEAASDADAEIARSNAKEEGHQLVTASEGRKNEEDTEHQDGAVNDKADSKKMQLARSLTGECDDSIGFGLCLNSCSVAGLDFDYCVNNCNSGSKSFECCMDSCPSTYPWDRCVSACNGVESSIDKFYEKCLSVCPAHVSWRNCFHSCTKSSPVPEEYRQAGTFQGCRDGCKARSELLTTFDCSDDELNVCGFEGCLAVCPSDWNWRDSCVGPCSHFIPIFFSGDPSVSFQGCDAGYRARSCLLLTTFGCSLDAIHSYMFDYSEELYYCEDKVREYSNGVSLGSSGGGNNPTCHEADDCIACTTCCEQDDNRHFYGLDDGLTCTSQNGACHDICQDESVPSSAPPVSVPVTKVPKKERAKSGKSKSSKNGKNAKRKKESRENLF